MSTQPILLVIGIAIAVNLVIMGGLLVTLIARRRANYATPEGIVEPPYRYGAMTTTPPTASSAISYIDDGTDDENAYDRASEDFDEDVSDTDPAGYRPLRPVMPESTERPETTFASFPTGGSTRPPTPPATRPSQPVVSAGHPLASASRPQATVADERLDWEIRLRSEEARLARYRRPVSVVLVELDGMERLIQRLGADAAERLIPPVRQTLTRQARAADYVARIGTSRFGIILPETDEIQAINYVERIRADCDRWLAAGAVATRLAIGWACPAPGGDLRTAARIAEDRLNTDRRRAFVRADYEPESVLPEAEPSAPIDAYEAGMPAEIELTPPTGPE
jgi:diguanylate cyclase (GGDEF)-like protein